MIVVEDVCRVFHDRKRGAIHALDHIWLDCAAGEVFGVLGPNGAGKTTLLRILATILKPTSGSVSVAGFNVLDFPHEVRRRIGFLSGSTGLYERLTPREFLTYFGELNGLCGGPLTTRIEQLFTDLDITDFADSRCDRLSTGQKQRVSIARAVVHDPPVLILDEPTNGLDVLGSRSIVRFIRDCRDAGRCVVFSSHIMSEVDALCDRICVIHQGRVAAVGTADDLRERTKTNSMEQVFLRLIGVEDIS